MMRGIAHIGIKAELVLKLDCDIDAVLGNFVSTGKISCVLAHKLEYFWKPDSLEKIDACRGEVVFDIDSERHVLPQVITELRLCFS